MVKTVLPLQRVRPKIFLKRGLGRQLLYIKNYLAFIQSVQFNSVAQSCPTVCNPMDCSTSGFPVHTMTWHYVSLPGGISGKEPTCQCRGCKRKEFDPWIGKILWRREWQLPPVFLPRESHGQKSLVGYSTWGLKELDMTE